MPVFPAGRPVRVWPVASLRGRGVSGTGSVRPRPRIWRTRRRERLRQRVGRRQVRTLSRAFRQSAPSPSGANFGIRLVQDSESARGSSSNLGRLSIRLSILRFKSIYQGGSYAKIFRADRRVRAAKCLRYIARASTIPIVVRSRDPFSKKITCFTVHPPAA